MATFVPSAKDIKRDWFLMDAENVVIGRLATEAARRLAGKHKPTYTTFLDTGDHVIIVNADKIVMTANKADQRMVHRYSGYPGGLKTESYVSLLNRKPDDAIRRTVRGMLPKGPLGRQTLKKLKIYTGPSHPHEAQQAKPFEITQVSQ